MNENLSEIQYDVTKKSKIRKFYEANKIFIFSTITILLIIVASISFYLDNKTKKKILLSDNYIKSQIHIKNGNKQEATKILKEIVFENDDSYSALSLFLIIDENLITEYDELVKMFNHLLENNKFEDEMKNLIIYKKALLQSDIVDEMELLEITKPLINNNTIWKPHALLLVGDFFVSRKEYSKAEEFYIQILSLKNLDEKLYEKARSKLVLIKNE
tara:strand:+ start:205 stop:852 length:648 start_codon:yes stop_codon:yes gene_type:complete